MTMNNKILTVSYGTFSCTLEGFDDSFGTMKAIAEYFRDLAADDRYFGAEPPVPDAEMLARIAEREISRRVQAREHEGRIVLSASGPEASDALVAAAPAAAMAAAQPAEDTAATAEDAVGDVVAEDEGMAVETAAEMATSEAEVEAEDIVEEVSAPVAGDAADETEVATAGEMADVKDAVAAEAEDTAQAPVADTGDTPEEAEAFFAASQANSIDAMADDSEEDVATEDTVAEEVAPATEAPPADSIAAKLQRIRAVVSQGQQDAAEDELFEDEHAEDVAPTIAASAMSEDDAADAEEDVIAEATRDIEEAFDIDDEASAEASEGEDDDVAAILARFDADAAADAAGLDTTGSEETPAAEGATEDDLGLDSLAALMAADEDEIDTSETGENLFGESNAADEAEAAPEAPRRARLIKVKRADIDAALASGQLEEVEDEDDEGPTSLTDQEEAELLAELAEVEAELPTAQDAQSEAVEAEDEDDLVAESDDADIMADGDADEVDPAAEEAVAAPDEDDSIAAEIEDEDEDRAQGDSLFEEDEAQAEEAAVAEQPTARLLKDDDVSRLMAEAENQMEEPEGSSRRNAFAHLKAAVQAKKADADIGNDSIKDEGAFRSDLAEVVKPRRPEVNASRGDRPESARPAPLKLVAEQRVDVGAAPKGPVRPRRVAAPQEAMTQDANGDDSFADYVAELGAHDLPALLEAAASYLSFVEGRDQFSRPQLMKTVRQVEKEDFSREDGLRSFGQLLRAGKIEKISGGRFTVTGDIGYRPEQRAAG